MSVCILYIYQDRGPPYQLLILCALNQILKSLFLPPLSPAEQEVQP